MPAPHAYRQLEAIRYRLPVYRPHGRVPQAAANILAIADGFDVFWFDAFGVLNVGPVAIDGAVAAVAALRAQGKRVFVLSNAASVGKVHMVERFAGLGYDFTADEIVTSRDAVLAMLADYPRGMTWGLIGLAERQQDLDALGIRTIHQNTAGFHARADGYLFLATADWDAARQQALIAALDARPRPVILGNPDLIAPMPDHISYEPGSYILTLPDALFANVRVCGKPFPAIYDIAVSRLDRYDPARTLMCGDTLHTDILGGNAYGVQTALFTAHGFYRGLDYAHYIADSGIVPDYLLPQL